MDRSLDQFATEIPKWFCKYKKSDYYPDYCYLMCCLPKKAARFGYLDLEDLCEIAIWGGNQHGVKQNLIRHNKPWDVQERTSVAIRYFHNPQRAIGAVLDLEHWGLTYASKTLMFMNPSSYVALDDSMRKSLGELLSPNSFGTRALEIQGYLKFLEVCRELQCKLVAPRTGHQNHWRLADIQQATFQFVQEGGCIKKCLA